MHADENHLEAADEITRHEQLEAGVGEGFTQGLQDGLIALDRGAAGKAGFMQPPGQGHDEQGGHAQRHQGLLPAQAADQPAFDRDHEELAEGAGRRGHTHGPGAPVHAHVAADHTVDHGIGGAGLGHADQHTTAQPEQQRSGCVGHADQAQGVEDGAGDDDLEGPVAVGQHAGKDAGKTPGQVLDGHGEGEGLA